MKKIINNKYIILIPILILNIISIIYLKDTIYLNRHLVSLLLCFISLFIGYYINIKYLLKKSNILYIISIFLLIIVLLFGKEINGSKAWIHLFNISIQPSEITKLSLVLFLINNNIHNKNIFLIFIYTIIPSILAFLEPDTGSIIIYIIILISIIKYSKNGKKYLTSCFILLTIFLSGNIILYYLNKKLFLAIYGNKIYYRINRIISFKKQNNIQNIYSNISIGSHHLLNIPENHNDFIFASIISKYNILFFILIITSYISIFLYYLKNIDNKIKIKNMINSSNLNILLFHTFYNIMMNLSLIPIIGIPLPFLSFGTSYSIVIYFLIGLSLNNT